MEFIYGEKTSPRKTIFKIISKKNKEVKIWNIWRIDDGPMVYGHYGGALYYESIANGKRYFCNDGYPDDDFDDVVFSLKWDI